MEIVNLIVSGTDSRGCHELNFKTPFLTTGMWGFLLVNRGRGDKMKRVVLILTGEMIDGTSIGGIDCMIIIK